MSNKLLPISFAVSLVILLTIVSWQKKPTTTSLAWGEGISGEELAITLAAQKQADKRAGAYKYDAPDEFMAFHHAIRTPEGADGPGYPVGFRQVELAKMQQRLQARGEENQAVNATWVERGPNNVAGRARAIIVDPDDASHGTWYVGSAGGGIWKTTNRGVTWSLISPDLPNLATTTLAMAETNHDIIYAGSGEGYFNTDAIRGDGIFRSTDRGNTWTQLASTAVGTDFDFVNKIIINPADENTLLVAANAGLFRSTDAGDTWTEVFSPSGRVQDLDADPSNWNRMYAGVNGNGIFRSNDAGLTWESASNGLVVSEAGASIRRVELAVSPVNTDHLFVSAEVANANDKLFFSNDGGDNWNEYADRNDLNPDLLGGQGWYDNTIVAHPYNENMAYIAGVEIYEFTLDGTISQSTPAVLGAVSAVDFITYVDFGGQFLGGGLQVSSRDNAINLETTDFTSIEIRFGAGLSQKAHRFTVPENGGSNGNGGAGVPATNYTYQDYVSVPFEVWDTDHNVQLNVSFRDQENDGAFDLEAGDDSDDSRAREYIFINATPYNASAPDGNVSSLTAGHTYKNTYFFWPRLADGASWTPESLPESKISVDHGSRVLAQGTTLVSSDPYGRYTNNNSSVHPDHHNLHIVKIDDANKEYWLINLNDGGGALSIDNAVTINQWGNSMRSTQFYGADKAPGEDRYVGGTQDNGTWITAAGQTATASTNYRFSLGGDGFESVWNFGNPLQAIGGSQFNGLGRTIDGGATWTGATSGMTDRGRGNAPFITRFGNGKSNPDYVFVVGINGVWRSTDFGGSWEVIDMGSTWNFSRSSQVVVSQADPAIVFAGGSTTEAGDLFVSSDFGASFSPMPDNGLVAGGISGIDGHPLDDSTVFVTYSFFGAPKVLRSQDLGQTWTDLTEFNDVTGESANGFPNVAAYCVQVMPHMPEVIWVGTEIGIVESADNGASWHLLDSELPAVSVWEMKYADGQIVVATHGRGIWTANIDGLPEIGIIPDLKLASIDAANDLSLDVELKTRFDSATVWVDDELAFKTNALEKGNLLLTGDYNADEGTHTVKMIGYLAGKPYRSMDKTFNLVKLAPLDKYITQFAEGTGEDFYGEGFTITTEQGFISGDYAIHSEHPYPLNKDISFRLLHPIIISEENATLYYKDVAIVEPGEAGVAFGEVAFYDYVVAEGSSDGGNTWTPLAPGYDASSDPGWLSAYSSTTNSGRQNLFEPHTYDLKEHYATGDTVIFRFRLHSDAGTNAWGWVIDNLHIQDPNLAEVTGALSKPIDLDIEVFPNPSETFTRVGFKLVSPEKITLSLMDLNGKVHVVRDLGRLNAGKHTVEIPLTNLPSGNYILSLDSEHGRQTQRLLKK